MLQWCLVAVFAVAACGDDRRLAGGPAPDAGDDDASTPPAVWCDDGNACTDDRFEGGACRSRAVEDGRACDDGDLCTLGDRCEAGACVAGAPSPGPLAQLGSVATAGGGGFGAVGNRMLAVVGPSWSARLALLERGAEVASWSGRLPVYLYPNEAIVHALDTGPVAITAPEERTLALFTVAPGAIRPRSQIELDAQILSLTSRGARLWMCMRAGLGLYSVGLVDATDPDAPVEVGSLPLPADCGSVAASDDGRRIYVNTRDGVRFVDASPLDTGGDPTLSPVIAPTAGVSTGGGLLVLREKTAVRVLRQTDHVEQLAVPDQGVLAASIAGGRLVLEGWRTAGPGLESYAAAYDVATGERLDEVVLQRVPFQGDLPRAFRNALTADGSILITSTGARMFDLAAQRFDEVRTPMLAQLGKLAPAAGGARAIGQTGAALIDLRDAASPVIASGGSFGRTLQLEAAIEDGSPWPQVLFGQRADIPLQAGVGTSWEPDPLAVARWQLEPDGRAQPTGSVLLPNRGPGRLLIAGDALYRLGLPVSPSTDAGLQIWPLAALGTTAPIEVALTPAPPLATAAGTRRAVIAVDPRARIAVVAIGAIDSAGRHGTALWIDLAARPPAVVDEIRFDGLPDDVRVAGTRAVVSTNLELVWLERGHAPTRMARADDLFIEHLLAFDGRTAYYAATVLGPGLAPDQLGAIGFGATTAVPPALPLHDTAESIIETATGLAIGTPAELVTVHPRCE